LTVVHAVAFATALDPESQEIGESREAAEERVLASVFEASQNAWQILRPAGADAANRAIDADKQPSFDAAAREEMAALLDHWKAQIETTPGHEPAALGLTAWRRRQAGTWARAHGVAPAAVLSLLTAFAARPSGRSIAALTTSNRERLAMWARTRDVTPEVALNALVDLALRHMDGSSAPPPWAADGIRRDLERVQARLLQHGEQLSAQGRMLDTIGACLAGVPYVVVKWCAAEQGDFDYEFSDGETPPAESEEGLRQAFAGRAEDLWHGMVAGLVDEPSEVES
jgi:hypothetical protein